MENNLLLKSTIQIARNAGDSILEIYNDKEKFQTISYKSDHSPLTLADKTSNKIICEALNIATPNIPIISEEGKKIEYNERKNWNKFWLIDPLDGTKEFVKRNGEFTVNIALIKNGKPVLGVVYAPVIDTLWYGSIDDGSYKTQNSSKAKKIEVQPPLESDSSVVRIVSSRSHSNNPKLNSYLTKFNNYKLIKMGSSIKICLIADGTAHYYPRFGPTMEWDTAAAHAVVKYAGGQIQNLNSHNELSYNKKKLLNPEFLVNYK